MPAHHKVDRSKYGVTWRLDNTGRLWKMSIGGGFYYDEEAGDFFSHPSSKVLRDYIISGRFQKEFPTRISCIIEDKQGRIWIPGPDNFLICIDHKKEVIYDFQKDIQKGLNAQSSDVRRLLEDRNGNIWVIMNGGSMYISPKVALFDRYQYDSYIESKPLYKQFQKYASDDLYRRLRSTSKNSEVRSVKEYRGMIYYAHDRAIHKMNPETRQHEMLPFVSTWVNDFLIYNNQLFVVDRTAVSIDLETLDVTSMECPFINILQSVPYGTDQFICEGQLDENGNHSLFLMNGLGWSVEKEIPLTYMGNPYPQPYIDEMVMLEDSILLINDLKHVLHVNLEGCLLYTSPSPRDKRQSRMPSSA